MSTYKKVLIALDFQIDNKEILERGTELAKSNSAELYIAHVNESLTVAYGSEGVGWSNQLVDLEISIRKDAEEKILQHGKDLSLEKDHCLLLNGNPVREIHEIAKQLNIDCIVMGTHGQSGWKLLLGSTANGVLHGSTCDVLAVRVGLENG